MAEFISQVFCFLISCQQIWKPCFNSQTHSLVIIFIMDYSLTFKSVCMIRHTTFRFLMNIFIASTHKIKLYTIDLREITKVKQKAICINNKEVFFKKRTQSYKVWNCQKHSVLHLFEETCQNAKFFLIKN